MNLDKVHVCTPHYLRVSEWTKDDNCSDKPRTVWLSSTQGAVIWASTAAASETSGSGRVSSDRISDTISTPPACNKNKKKKSSNDYKVSGLYRQAQLLCPTKHGKIQMLHALACLPKLWL
jgi:hypothetical protein